MLLVNDKVLLKIYYHIAHIYSVTVRLLDPMITKSTQVVVFQEGGVASATKFRYRYSIYLNSVEILELNKTFFGSFRCRDCPVFGEEVQYHPDQYGSPSQGYKFYGHEVDLVRGSRSTWYNRSLMQYFFSGLHHAWVR